MVSISYLPLTSVLRGCVFLGMCGGEWIGRCVYGGLKRQGGIEIHLKGRERQL